MAESASGLEDREACVVNVKSRVRGAAMHDVTDALEHEGLGVVSVIRPLSRVWQRSPNHMTKCILIYFTWILHKSSQRSLYE